MIGIEECLKKALVDQRREEVVVMMMGKGRDLVPLSGYLYSFHRPKSFESIIHQ